MRRRLFIIHNTFAGTRRQALLKAVSRILEEAGAHVRIEHAGDIDQDRAAARSAAVSGEYDAVVAAGGDSTIRGVASGLIGSGVPLGIIPIGTGNVVAREIGIGFNASTIAGYLLGAPGISVRCGLADDTPFLAMAGIGYDADVLRRLSTEWKRGVGRAAYAWPILRESVSKPRPFEVEVDGRLHTATWVIAARTAHYGGSFVIAPNQSLADDGFHAVIANVRSRRARAALLVSIALGRHEARPDVLVVPCKRLSLSPQSMIAAQVDGERLASIPHEITLSSERLNLIVPEASPLATSNTATDGARTGA